MYRYSGIRESSDWSNISYKLTHDIITMHTAVFQWAHLQYKGLH